MAGILTFKVALVRKLIEHSLAAKQHRPSYEDLFNPEFHKGGVIQYDDSGWPQQDNLDQSKLPAGLLLVKDQGVYLLSAGEPALLVDGDSNRPVVVYAIESDPTAGADFEDWYGSATEIMGGDDCVISLPCEMFSAVMASKARLFRVRVTEQAIEVLPPGVRA